jgi:poly(A) polymerase
MTPFNGKLSKQAWMGAPETLKVMQALQEDGGSARFVGGCVRNALANRKILDIDIATPLKPDEVMARLKKNKIPYAPTGLKHGTVTAIVDGKPFEITTLRVDVNPHGRHADVRFTEDWRIDAARRDFTINAMSATLEGEVFDPFGGIKDLREGRVIFVGDADKRIHEDILRILRFFRFYAHFGQGPADPCALKACIANAALLPRLSAERIRQETLKILEAPRAAEVWKTMLENGITTHFLPEATDVRALERLIVLETAYHSQTHVLRRLAALLVINQEGFKHAAAGLRLSNDQTRQLHDMLFPKTPVTTQMDAADIRKLVYISGNDMARSLLLLAAAKEGTENNLKTLYEIATAFRAPRFPLEGTDVINLGYKAGPDVGLLLKSMEDWWINQDFQPGRTQCLEHMKAISPRHTPPADL